MSIHHRALARRAFTLIEVLVVIGIIAILVGLALPALAGARTRAFDVRSQANIRHNATMISAYCVDMRGHFPIVIENQTYDVGSSSFIYPYWQVDQTWVAVVKPYWPNEVFPETFYSPRSSRSGLFGLGSYRYSWSFAGKPAMWSGSAFTRLDTRTSPVDADVRWPSSKAILWDDEVAYRSKRPARIRFDATDAVAIALSDQSVVMRVPADASAPVDNQDWPSIDDQRLRNTREGVWGRDF
ncbi:MAG: type II secretion system protein [Phycisphaerae bacterium]|jgi:prepilin-type N-terminal cleavage/methylation domain-containing protein